MSDRASKALAEASLPGDPRTYDATSKAESQVSPTRRSVPPAILGFPLSRVNLFERWDRTELGREYINVLQS